MFLLVKLRDLSLYTNSEAIISIYLFADMTGQIISFSPAIFLASYIDSKLTG